MASHLASMGKVGPTIGEHLSSSTKVALDEQKREEMRLLILRGLAAAGTSEQSCPLGGEEKRKNSRFVLFLSSSPTLTPPTPKPPPPKSPPPLPLPPQLTSGLLRPRGPLRLRPAQALQPPHARLDPVVRGGLEAAGRGPTAVDGARGRAWDQRGLRPGEEGRVKREKDGGELRERLPTLFFSPSLPSGT